MTKNTALKVIAWTQAAVVTGLSFYIWGNLYNWQMTNLSNYQLFPLFGLLAFSLMWGHYFIAALRNYWQLEKQVVNGYFEITSFGVLLAILLHPSLFIGQLFADGFGLPPASYKSYVAPGMIWIVMLGTLSWFVFMAYELNRFFSNRSWWKYFIYASDIAMLAIFYHGLTLGGHLQNGWFRLVWYFYGITLLMALIYLRFINKSTTVSKNVK